MPYGVRKKILKFRPLYDSIFWDAWNEYPMIKKETSEAVDRTPVIYP